MLAQFPLDNVALGNKPQHTLNDGAKIGKDAQHFRFGARGGVRGADPFCEVDVGLRGGDVVYGVVGDGVGDEVALFADPADDAVAVKEGEEFRVVGELGTLEHDAVRGLACVCFIEECACVGEEGGAGGGFDAVCCEEEVDLDLVSGVVTGVAVWLDGEGGFGSEGFDAGDGVAQLEGDGRLALTGFVHAAGEVCAVAGAVRVAVFLFNIWHGYVGQLFACVSFCGC